VGTIQKATSSRAYSTINKMIVNAVSNFVGTLLEYSCVESLACSYARHMIHTKGDKVLVCPIHL
jgi:hypothetical protein